MTPRFAKFMPFILEWEGRAYEDVKDDPGGPTKFGIDHRSHPHEDIRNLTESRATEIYFNEYWTPNGCELMPSGLGEVHMNACVNTGKGRAAQLLAEARGDVLDYLAAQEAFYRRLVKARPKSVKFLKGWLNRLGALKKFERL